MSVRYNRPLTYRGRNRIICVFTFFPTGAGRFGKMYSLESFFTSDEGVLRSFPSSQYGNTIVVHYGRIPEETVNDLEQRIGDIRYVDAPKGYWE